jgi:serine/threonine protein kinase
LRECTLVKLKLIVIAGPHLGRQFVFDGHDTFLVGRTKEAHFQLAEDDPSCSRRHCLLEVNPPRCRVIDLQSRKGTLLNGTAIQMAEVADGDEIGVGDTVFKVFLVADADEKAVLERTVHITGGLVNRDLRAAPPAVPGYQLLAELGRGGLGVVHRATREQDGLAVAVKTLQPAVGISRKQIDRFLRDCQILAQLEHLNIVTLREFGEAGSWLFLVMDLVEGADLGARLKEKGAEDARTAVRVVCQMLAGLAHAHAKGLVHRDIKPSNILINRDGTKRIVKLVDFGLAHVCESCRIGGLALLGEAGSTLAFMAPEQATHYRQLKPSADQYSAAATLYTMLTNCHTHNLPNDLGAQIAHLVTAAPVPITERKPEIPTELAEVIHKALSREPKERYPNVLAFREELKRFA